MRKLASIALIAVTCLICNAESKNLLVNGKLEAEQLDQPPFWRSVYKTTTFVKGKGPEGMNFITLKGKGTITFRQSGIKLVPGEKYRLSGYFRTSNFIAKNAGFVIHNKGWGKDAGIKKFARNSGWRKLSCIFTAFPSRNKLFGATVFIAKAKGELSFTDLSLEPLTEKAKKESSGLLISGGARLVPIEPLLNRIPADNPSLSFKLLGELSGDIKDYECIISSKKMPEQKISLESKTVKINLKALAVGDHFLSVKIVKTADNKTVFERAYPITLIKKENVAARYRKLNNLVSELVNKQVAKPQAVDFVNPEDGWIYISIPQGANVTINSDNNSFTTAEVVRLLPAGKYKLFINGNFKPGNVIVRKIPEIINYPACVSSFVKENGKYDWTFTKKHILPAVTTLNGGRLSKQVLKEVKREGLLWLSNFNVRKALKKSKTSLIVKELEKSPGIADNKYDGVTVDELFFSAPRALSSYTDVLYKFLAHKNKLVYSWVVGTPVEAAISTDFISMALNSSGGKGKVLFEAYCHPQSDEKAADDYLNHFLCKTVRGYQKLFPGITKGLGVVFGNFNQVPYISLEYDPHVDMKYYLDMQLNKIANAPEFRGLSCTGYWGSHHADEEMIRWAFKLMRHYAIEGRTDMLSKKYGFQYSLNYLKNCDFEDGLKSWQVTGNAKAGSYPDFGRDNQGRWCRGRGDKFCIMTKESDSETHVTQKAQGLIPGKYYSIQFLTADYNDLKNKENNPKYHGINVILPGAKIIKEKSYVHVEKSTYISRKRGKVYIGVNLNRVVFQAKTSTQEVIFSNAESKIGEKLIFNFVQLKPYFNN